MSMSVSPNNQNTARSKLQLQHFSPATKKKISATNAISIKFEAMQVNYKSAEKYTGSDTLELLVLYPGGFAREVQFDINVR